jgi:hypothetical protein
MRSQMGATQRTMEALRSLIGSDRDAGDIAARAADV